MRHFTQPIDKEEASKKTKHRKRRKKKRFFPKLRLKKTVLRPGVKIKDLQTRHRSA